MPNALSNIHTFEELVRYLENELHWPLHEYGLEDLSFEYSPEELGLKEADAAKVKRIRQLRPLDERQPWGIFFVEFEQKRLPVAVMRRILGHLSLKKRASANRADRMAWGKEDLLFITAFGGEKQPELALAHFHEKGGDMPTLRVLGWDGGDTPLKLSHLQQELTTHLRWPDDADDLAAWRAAWAKPFKHGVRHTIRTADALAEAMAELARRIRDAASTLMKVESEKGPLRRMHAAFRTALIHDLTEEGFADTYAQTITYGLLTAAISRTDLHGGKHGTNLVADNVADMVPITNPFLKEMLQSFLKVGGRKGGIDFDELGIQDVVHLFRSEETDLPAVIRDFDNKTRGEDPVIHFYEHFLAKYSKKLKVERGVFYTPKPVVGFIVRSVDELLRTEFGIEDGLASTITWRDMVARNAELKIPDGTDPDSPFVMVLDPATGTATFLVEVIDLVHKRLNENWAKGGLKAMPKLPGTNFPRPIEDFKDYWNSYVALSLLRRLHGYELMMAPYAIAHMKIGLKLAETGYRFGTEERARVYLTNALEPPSRSIQLSIADWAPALAHEAEAVNQVKQNQHFSVVLGNPPYSIQSQNLTPTARAWVDAYRRVAGVPIVERNALQFEKNIQDDYIKFLRLAEDGIDKSGCGVVGFVTNHGFLDGATFRGMRWHLMQSFTGLSVLNLHGNSNKGETASDGSKDENVFDISQGVAVSLFVKTSRHASGQSVKYFDLWGPRMGDSGAKYGWLLSNVSTSTSWEAIVPREPLYLFKPAGGDLEEEYERFPGLGEIMPLYSMGIKSSRDELVLDFESQPLLERIERFRSARVPDATICEELGVPLKKGWNVANARRDLKAVKHLEPLIKQFLYRPFDWRLIFYHKAVVFSAAQPVMKNLMDHTNLALVATRQTKDQWDVQCCRTLVGHKSVGAYDANSVFPLYILGSGAGLAFDDAKRANLSPGVLRHFTRLSQGQAGKSSEVTPEGIFHYAYAVFHSPGYRNRYGSFLKAEFPRLPLPVNEGLFHALTRIGEDLVAVHLLESPRVNKYITMLIGDGDAEVEKVSWGDNTVWIDKAQRTGFKGVPEAVWNYHVGGYQVCEKWLKDRGPKKGKPGRTLSAEDIAHYQKIVVALCETIRIQKEIDEVIEQHGGWPGAFATNAPLTTEATEPLAQPKAEKPKATKAKAPKDLEPEDGPGYIPDPGEIPFG